MLCRCRHNAHLPACCPARCLPPAPAPAEHLFEQGSPQHDFIRADLAALNRSATPWLVVGGHRPPYIDSTFYGLVPDGDQVVARQLRASLEDLFYSYQVCCHGGCGGSTQQELGFQRRLGHG